MGSLIARVLIGAALVGAGYAISLVVPRSAPEMAPAVAPAAMVTTDPVARGRYLVQTSGCNDCHTPGYMMNDGTTRESEWLVGTDLGWNGPWGVTYAANVRAIANAMSEAEWLDYTATLRVRPPMPWPNINAMSETDRSAMWHFLRAMGPSDNAVPTYQPPGETPASVWVDMTARLPDGSVAGPPPEVSQSG